MSKFRKKPVIIEAFQMTKERRWDNSEWPNWLHEAWQQGAGEGGLWCDKEPPSKTIGEWVPEQLYLGTLEGAHIVTWGDWIIKGIEGELYPCKPDIFKATYEPVASCEGIGTEFKWCANPETCRIVHIELSQLKEEKNRTEEMLLKVLNEHRAWQVDFAALNRSSPDYDPEYRPRFSNVTEEAEEFLRAKQKTS